MKRNNKIDKKIKLLRILTYIFGIIAILCMLSTGALYVYAGPQVYDELYSIVEVKALIQSVYILEIVSSLGAAAMIIISAILEKKVRLPIRYKPSTIVPDKFLGIMEVKE